MKGFPMQSSVSALKQTKQASPMKVAGGVYSFNPGEGSRSGGGTQISQSNAEKMEAIYKKAEEASDAAEAKGEDGTLIYDKIVREAYPEWKGARHKLDFTGIDTYTNPLSPNYIEGVNNEEDLIKYRDSIEEFSDEWYDVDASIKNEDAHETRTQEMLNKQ